LNFLQSRQIATFYACIKIDPFISRAEMKIPDKKTDFDFDLDFDLDEKYRRFSFRHELSSNAFIL